MGGRDVSQFMQEGRGDSVLRSIDGAFQPAGFKSFADRVATERVDRARIAKRVMSFGIRFLDKALGGIFPNDLILIGAGTGAGKTEASTGISLFNAEHKRRVHYFALEAEPMEIERRVKFRYLTKLVQENSAARAQFRRMNYLDWYAGRIDDITGPFEAQADASLAARLKSFYTFYKSGDFTSKQMVEMFKAVQDETDLIVLDHLHYVDSDDPNENRGFKIITKKLRDVALEIGRPVICNVHIRKGDRSSPRLVPSIDDIHGTSDVPKIATKAVMIAPAYDRKTELVDVRGNPLPWIWPTYFSVVKCRADGSRARYAAVVDFDARASSYLDDFDIGRLSWAGDTFDPLGAGDVPVWAEQQGGEDG